MTAKITMPPMMPPLIRLVMHDDQQHFFSVLHADAVVEHDWLGRADDRSGRAHLAGRTALANCHERAIEPVRVPE